MLKPYVIAGKLPKKNESVVVITREDCIPGILEPITCAGIKEEADTLADKIITLNIQSLETAEPEDM